MMQDVTKFSALEMAIMENIDREYKWLAKDKTNGKLYLYGSKPRKTPFVFWDSGFDNYIPFSINNLFQQIQWEDEEPVCIDDICQRR